MYWCRAVFWIRVSLRGAPSLKKTDSPQQPPIVYSSSAKHGVSQAPLPFILGFWLPQSCTDLLHAVATTESLCEWPCCHVWKILFPRRCLLSLFLTVFLPSLLRWSVSLGGGCHIDAPSRIVHPTVLFSICWPFMGLCINSFLLQKGAFLSSIKMH